jgi:hypothetical protein
MKPAAPVIDPSKRTVITPERQLSKAEAGLIVRVFLILLLVPMLFEFSAWISPSKTNLLAGWVRSAMQPLLLHTLHDAGSELHRGPDGWLFEQRELDRLLSVPAGERALHQQLVSFMEELQRRGIPLVLVAVPERSTLHPEEVHFRVYHEPLRATGELAGLQKLRRSGCEVLDLTEPLWKLKLKERLHLASDPFWTPEAMKHAVVLTERLIREKHRALEGTETPLISASILTRQDSGAYAKRLAPRRPLAISLLEKVEITSLTGQPLEDASPVLLLGSELMWAYDDATAGFGGDSSGGFITHLMAQMRRSIAADAWPLRDMKRLDDKQLVVLVLTMKEVLP